MIARCYNKNNKAYINYGGRGITVCDRWRNSYEDFANDMGIKPEGYSLDRINNELGYSPDNCKWSTVEEQLSNRRHYKNNSTGHIGIYYNSSRDKWTVNKTVGGKSKYIGIYKTKEEAIEGYHDFVGFCSYCDK